MPALTLLFCFLAFAGLRLLGGATPPSLAAPTYLVFHNAVEFFSVAVSVSIFGLGWYSFGLSRSRYGLVLGCAFLAIGLLDSMHAMSFPGMPAFFTPNSTNKGVIFWLAARFATAAAFLILAFFDPSRPGMVGEKGLGLVFALGVAGLAFSVVILMPERLPPMFIEGVGLTGLKKALEYLVVALFALAFLVIWRRRGRGDDPAASFSLAALILCVFGELCFTLYRSAYDAYNMSGHLFKLVAFVMIYRGLFLSALRRPYLRLLSMGEELGRENEVRKVAEAELTRINRELTVVSECNQALVRAHDENQLLEDICRIIVDLGGYRFAWVGYARDDEERSVEPVRWKGVEDGYLAEARISWADTAFGRGPTGTCIRTARTRYEQDLLADPDFAPWTAAAAERGYRSIIALPLKRGDASSFGALSIYSSAPSAFIPAEKRLLEELAGDLSFGILAIRIRAEHRESEARNLDALREKEALLRELYHRTKNNMQVICSILYLEAGFIKDEKVELIFKAIENRIQAMSMVHLMLYLSHDLTRVNLRTYVRELASLLLSSYVAEPGKVELELGDMEDVELLIDSAIPCGLLLNELIANALIHGFPGERRGKVRVSLRKDGSGTIHLTVADDGVGLPPGTDPRKVGRMGFLIIFDLVRAQLGGKVELDARKGMEYRITFRDSRYEPRV